MKIIPFEQIENSDGTPRNVPLEPFPAAYKMRVAGDSSYTIYEEGDDIPADIIAKMNPVSE